MNRAEVFCELRDVPVRARRHASLEVGDLETRRKAFDFDFEMIAVLRVIHQSECRTHDEHGVVDAPDAITNRLVTREKIDIRFPQYC
jgi:hypothetical protein